MRANVRFGPRLCENADYRCYFKRQVFHCFIIQDQVILSLLVLLIRTVFCKKHLYISFYIEKMKAYQAVIASIKGTAPIIFSTRFRL